MTDPAPGTIPWTQFVWSGAGTANMTAATASQFLRPGYTADEPTDTFDYPIIIAEPCTVDFLQIWGEHEPSSGTTYNATTFMVYKNGVATPLCKVIDRFSKAGVDPDHKVFFNTDDKLSVKMTTKCAVGAGGSGLRHFTVSVRTRR